MKHFDKSEYFEQDEFLNTLKKYEDARKNGKDVYFDEDVLANISNYYETHDNSLAAIEAI